MTITPQIILTEARSWLGTPFRHQGRVKGVGCDCIGLIVGVAKELGVRVPLPGHAQRDPGSPDNSMEVPNNAFGISGKWQEADAFPGCVPLASFDRTDYPRQPDGKTLQETLERYLLTVTPAQAGVQRDVDMDTGLRRYDMKKIIQPADILLFRFEEEPQHVGFASDYAAHSPAKRSAEPGSPEGITGRSRINASAFSGMCNLGLIHCYARSRKVVEHRLDEAWIARLVGVYRFK